MPKPSQVMKMKQMGQAPPGMPAGMMTGMPAQAAGSGPKRKAGGPKKKGRRK